MTDYVKLYYPEGVGAGDLLPLLAKRGVVVAGGLHTSMKGSVLYSPLWFTVTRAYNYLVLCR